MNEHIKLVTTTLNAVSLVIFAAAALQPLLAADQTTPGAGIVNWPWVAFGLILHVSAHGVIRLIRPE